MDERVVSGTLPGRRKAAILLVSLGSKGAADVFRHLPNEMIEQLTVEMAKMQAVEPEYASTVMQEMVDTAYARGYIA
jgi:flagellar motor switch protein FliG